MSLSSSLVQMSHTQLLHVCRHIYETLYMYSIFVWLYSYTDIMNYSVTIPPQRISKPENKKIRRRSYYKNCWKQLKNVTILNKKKWTLKHSKLLLVTLYSTIQTPINQTIDYLNHKSTTQLTNKRMFYLSILYIPLSFCSYFTNTLSWDDRNSSVLAIGCMWV